MVGGIFQHSEQSSDVEKHQDSLVLGRARQALSRQPQEDLLCFVFDLVLCDSNRVSCRLLANGRRLLIRTEPLNIQPVEIRRGC